MDGSSNLSAITAGRTVAFLYSLDQNIQCLCNVNSTLNPEFTKRNEDEFFENVFMLHPNEIWSFFTFRDRV